MDLALHQRQLLGLFRSTCDVGQDDDAYIQTVARSRDLREGRRNILLWRVWVLKRTCPLTFTLLRRRGILEESVAAFISQQNISPFRETQAPVFLEWLGGHSDRLVACVAGFERALTKVRQGDGETHILAWPVDPGPVLHSVAKDTALPDERTSLCDERSGGPWATVISRDLPGGFEIVCRDEAEIAVPGLEAAQ